MKMTKLIYVSFIALFLAGFHVTAVQAQTDKHDHSMDMKDMKQNMEQKHADMEQMRADMEQMRVQMEQIQALMKDNMEKYGP